ncbi:hypothetical protein ACFWOJ_32825 [Streptomyces sp. NPDC058439]|uniref:hypothetical protein n=1 Tax=Streptomyces sp. NPDC058439 TaxID=3346500 RepID=UPI003659A9FA
MAAAEDPVPGGRGRILPPTAGPERGRRASPTFRWEYSVGWYLAEREQATIEIVDRKKLWQPTTGEGGHVREDARTLRYRILHVPARLVRGRRKRRLKLFETGLRTAAIVRALTRILALPHPT